MGKKRLLIGCYHKSVILTYVGVGAALCGIFYLLQGGEERHIRAGLLCLITGGLCDLFDGPVARRCQRTQTEEAYGVQIDSLADVTVSLLLPVLLLFRMGQNINAIIIVATAILYTLAGITRLAWFSVLTAKQDEGRITCYQGLPVTYMALILPLYRVIGQAMAKGAAMAGADGGMLLRGGDIMVVVLYLVVAFLFVLHVDIKKPVGIWYLIFPILAVIVSVLVCIL